MNSCVTIIPFATNIGDVAVIIAGSVIAKDEIFAVVAGNHLKLLDTFFPAGY